MTMTEFISLLLGSATQCLDQVSYLATLSSLSKGEEQANIKAGENDLYTG